MTATSIGDLARSFQLRRDSAEIRKNLVQLTSELSTGRRADLAGYLGGDLSQLSSLERGIERNISSLTILAERRLEISSVQAVLSEVRTLAGDVSDALVGLPEVSDLNLVKSAGKDAENRFASVVSALNTQVGGRSIFAGTATDSRPLADHETILASLESEIALAGGSTVAAVIGVVESWFGTGGGFESIGYAGSAQEISGVPLSDTENSLRQPTALDGAIRDSLSALSIGALLGRGLLEADPSEALQLAKEAGLRMKDADRAMIALQAEVGGAENQIQRATIEVKSELNLLELARSELIGADPYETAVQLEMTEVRLETIYTVTSRLADLSLARYL